MANTCQTCKRDDVDQINKLITAKTPIREIVEKFEGTTTSGLDRHKDCITALFDDVREEKRAGLLASVDEIKTEIKAIQSEFSDNGNIRLGAVGKMIDVLDKEAKLTGAYQEAQRNQTDLDKVVEGYRIWEKRYPDAPANARTKWIQVLADASGVDVGELTKRIGQQVH